MNKNISYLVLILGLSLFTQACDPMKPADVIAQVKVLLGIQPEKKGVPAEVKDELGHVQDPTKVKASELAKANSELLSEMMKVIFNQDEVEDKSDFGGLVRTLDQGASLEGIYEGIMMGSRYRALESKSQAASPTELKAFAVELADLQLSMKNPSVFEASEARKAPSIDYPDGSSIDVPTATAGSQEVTPKKDRMALQTELVQTFIGASGFTLKRTIAEEALKKMDEMKSDSGELAQWYAHFVLRMCETKVDFGLELRNKPDFDFHFSFAQKMALDRVKWEVLNRYHRYFNWISTQK